MFLGEYEPNVDEKGRLTLPKKIREGISGHEVIVTRGFERCIFGYEKTAWQEATGKELLQPITDVRSRANRRYLFSGAAQLELDGQGRLVIPRNLLRFADIREDVAVIGAGDHFEIWAKSLWQNEQRKLEEA